MSAQLRDRTYAALFMMIGIVLASLKFGQPDEERRLLAERAREFGKLSPQAQREIREAHSDFLTLPGTRQDELRKIHAAITQSQELDEAADRYLQWWSSLTREETQRFKVLSEAERLNFVREMWSRSEQEQGAVEIEFQGPSSVRLPRLKLKYEEFWQCLNDVVPPEQRDAELKAEIDALSDDSLKALRLSLAVFEDFGDQSPGKFQELQERAQALRRALVTFVSDSEWKTQFETISAQFRTPAWGYSWLMMTQFRILDRATISIGDELRKRFPVTQEQIVAAFSELEDRNYQHSLMLMAADEARTQLELIAQSKAVPGPEQRLLVLFNEFTRKRQSYLRIPFRFGSPGSGRDRNGFGRQGPGFQKQ